ncbi:MAG: hypothetical protein DWI59_06235 [Chloroflexi bacterium]|nr:MAG: hypothetical protein DWI59_06235 [Chloroflexota bacterium]
MASSFTTNKRIEKPANNDDIDTWDVPVNADWDIIDEAFGGRTEFNVTGLTATPVILTYAEYRPAQFSFVGVLSANVTYEIPINIGGTWVVNNATTGLFTLQITSDGGGTSATLASGSSIVVCDGTNVRHAVPSTASPGGGVAWYLVTSSQTVVAAAGYIVDTTSGAITLTLPAAPSVGDYVAVCDDAGTFATNNLTIGRNSLNIEGVAANLTCNIDGQSFGLVYGGAAPGWRVAI